MSDETGGEIDGAAREAQREEWLERAHEAGDEGDFEQMVEVLREALEQLPGDPFVLCWLGVAERELGFDGIAYERFKQAVAADPGDPWLLATAGNALAAFDDPEAEGVLRTAALLGPEVPTARWMYGAYLTREGLFDDGLAELRAARDLAPDDAVISYEMGVNRWMAGDPGEALTHFAEAVERAPDDGWTRVVLGLALFEAEQLDEAVREFEAGARLRDDDAEAQFLAALALAAWGDDDSAWLMLERGRLSAEGTDTLTADAVEERLGEGHEEALQMLAEQLAPSALRERLGARP